MIFMAGVNSQSFCFYVLFYVCFEGFHQVFISHKGLWRICKVVPMESCWRCNATITCLACD